MSPLVQRALVAALGVVAIHVPLVPVDHAADRVANPDMLFCLLAAWTIRRPDAVPLLLVLALGLAADLLLGRPPGPGALGLVLATEYLRGRRPSGFAREFARAALLFAAMLAATSLLLVLTLAPGPGLEALARHWFATVLAYPVVAGLLQLGLPIRPQAAR
jgi:rod shape-determining protein MreD